MSGHVRRSMRSQHKGLRSSGKKIKDWLRRETPAFSSHKENIFFRSMRTIVCALGLLGMEFESWTQTHTLASFTVTRSISGCVPAVGTLARLNGIGCYDGIISMRARSIGALFRSTRQGIMSHV